MSDWLVPLIAAALAVVGSLGGVALTQRHQLRISRAEWRAADRAEVRELLTRLIRVANDWVSQMELQVLVIGKMTNDDLLTYADSNAMARLGEINSALRASFGEAALRIADRPLLEAVSQANVLYTATGEEVFNKILPSRNKETPFDNVLEAGRHVLAFGRAITRLESVAANYVRTEIGPADGSGNVGE